MSLDLSAYPAIQTNLFLKLDIPDYEVLTFSDYHSDFTIDSVDYTGLGSLLSVSDTVDNLRATPQEVTVSISGIPATNVTAILNNRVKGSDLVIYRAFFNVNTAALLSITGNPAQKFRGIVSNYDITDDLDVGSSTGTVSLTLTVTSVIEMLNNKVNGRRTNPIDFPSESSMSRVAALAKSNFNFGAPQ